LHLADGARHAELLREEVGEDVLGHALGEIADRSRERDSAAPLGTAKPSLDAGPPAVDPLEIRKREDLPGRRSGAKPHVHVIQAGITMIGPWNSATDRFLHRPLERLRTDVREEDAAHEAATAARTGRRASSAISGVSDSMHA
jgi:hypothetical protein